jgi:hypothetical protein
MFWGEAMCNQQSDACHGAAVGAASAAVICVLLVGFQPRLMLLHQFQQQSRRCSWLLLHHLQGALRCCSISSMYIATQTFKHSCTYGDCSC